MAKRRMMRRRAKRKIWAWIGGRAAMVWNSGNLIAGSTYNVIMVDEPVLSSHGLDANTAVHRTVGRIDIQSGSGPFITFPRFGYACWAGEEDVTDTPVNAPVGLALVSPSADMYARKDILRMDQMVLSPHSSIGTAAAFDPVSISLDIRSKRKVSTKGHVSIAFSAQTAANEESSISATLWYRCLVVADYR